MEIGKGKGKGKERQKKSDLKVCHEMGTTTIINRQNTFHFSHRIVMRRIREETLRQGREMKKELLRHDRRFVLQVVVMTDLGRQALDKGVNMRVAHRYVKSGGLGADSVPNKNGFIEMIIEMKMKVIFDLQDLKIELSLKWSTFEVHEKRDEPPR